jgi:hypothetical protein
MKTLQYIQTGCLLGTVALAACADDPIGGPSDGDMLQGGDRITVENDAGTLAARVSRASLELDVIPIRDAPLAAPPRRDEDGGLFKIFLIATVTPPVVRDITLQATHIVVRGNRALVAYNVQGPDRAGGVDVFDITHPDSPRLVSEAVFTDTDVSALDLHANTVFLAAATSDAAFGSPAVLEALTMKNGLTDDSRRIDLPSYAGTGVKIQGGTAYATSGDLGGGISAYDSETLDLRWFHAIPDARAVDTKGDDVVVMRGTPGALHIFDGATGDLLRSFETGGADIPESKSTVQVARGLIYYAAGAQGMRVVDFDDGTVVADVPVPDLDGVDSEFEVTNAVSLNGTLVFMANGGAGLQVVRASRNVEKGGDLSGDDLSFQTLGNVVFPDGESANFVGGKGNLLFAATGTGGLHIIKIVHEKEKANGQDEG